MDDTIPKDNWECATISHCLRVIREMQIGITVNVGPILIMNLTLTTISEDFCRCFFHNKNK